MSDTDVMKNEHADKCSLEKPFAIHQIKYAKDIPGQRSWSVQQ